MFFFIYDILVFLDFLFVLQTLQYISTYLDSIENILLLFYHSFDIHCEKMNSNKLLPFSMKSINPIQKYSHIFALHI